MPSILPGRKLCRCSAGSMPGGCILVCLKGAYKYVLRSHTSMSYSRILVVSRPHTSMSSILQGRVQVCLKAAFKYALRPHTSMSEGRMLVCLNAAC